MRSIKIGIGLYWAMARESPSSSISCADAWLATNPLRPLLTLWRTRSRRRFHSSSATKARKSVTLKNVNSVGDMVLSFRVSIQQQIHNRYEVEPYLRSTGEVCKTRYRGISPLAYDDLVY